MFGKKITKVMLLTLCIVMVGSVSAFAASYSFYFKPPFNTSLQSSPSVKTDGTFTPYVDPAGATAPTTYFITTPNSATDIACNAVMYVVSAKTYLTYNTGYGAGDQSYRLRGCPSYSDFQSYSCAGEWKP